jgi:hypothetical protein
MQTMHDGLRGLALLVEVGSDKLFFLSALAVALMLGAFVALQLGPVAF